MAAEKVPTESNPCHFSLCPASCFFLELTTNLSKFAKPFHTHYLNQQIKVLASTGLMTFLLTCSQPLSLSGFSIHKTGLGLLASEGQSPMNPPTYQAEGRQQEGLGFWAGGPLGGSHSQQLHPLGLIP